MEYSCWADSCFLLVRLRLTILGVVETRVPKYLPRYASAEVDLDLEENHPAS